MSSVIMIITQQHFPDFFGESLCITHHIASHGVNINAEEVKPKKFSASEDQKNDRTIHPPPLHFLLRSFPYPEIKLCMHTHLKVNPC